MIERERRFLVDGLPEPLPTGEPIEQAYITTGPASVRVRRQGDALTLTIKTGSGMRRVEVERTLTPDEFDAVWEAATELRIEKIRHRLDLDAGLVAELDLFGGALDGRRLVEVEFTTDEAAREFEPPAWFGREVTDDGRYTNASLARHGWPED